MDSSRALEASGNGATSEAVATGWGRGSEDGEESEKAEETEDLFHGITLKQIPEYA